MAAIDSLLAGAVDLHLHSGPSPMPRRVTHAEAAKQADEVGFRAVLAKCHYHDTVTDIIAMAPLLAGLNVQVFGGIALNSPNGGLNPYAVNRSLKMGGKMVWFPTISAKAHIDHFAPSAGTHNHFQPMGMMPSQEVSVFDDSGDVQPVVREIIGQAKEAGACVSTGHLGYAEARAVVEAAAEAGHTQILVSHPNFIVGIEPQQAKELTKLGATIEHDVAMYYDDRHFTLPDLLEWIDFIGPEHTSLGSDLGQAGNPLPVDGYRQILGKLLDSGVPEKAIRQMVSDNPGRLIGLD
jgi:hypothetical protein